MWILPTKTLDGTSEEPKRMFVSNNDVPAVIGSTLTIHLFKRNVAACFCRLSSYLEKTSELNFRIGQCKSADLILKI